MDPFPDGVNVQLMAHSYFTKRNHSYRSKVTKSLVALVALPGIQKKTDTLGDPPQQKHSYDSENHTDPQIFHRYELIVLNARTQPSCLNKMGHQKRNA
jgi:hypothetical protein